MLSNTTTSATSNTTNTTEWSLSLVTFDNTFETSRTVIFHGLKHQYPSTNKLSKVIPIDISEESLEELAVQICKYAPVQAIPSLLSSILCVYCRQQVVVADHQVSTTTSSNLVNNMIDVKILKAIANQSKRSVCGVVFKQGDIVWTCRQCAKVTSYLYIICI